MVKDEIANALKKAVKEVSGLDVEPEVFRSAGERHGDYSTNIAMIMFVSSKLQLKTQKFGTPMDLAEAIASNVQRLASSSISKVEAVKPGFVNFWLSADYLVSRLQEVLKHDGEVAPTPSSRSAKRIMVEFAHPNTHKSFHIGHLRNISIGESIVRLLEANDHEVIRANYEGDVGMHIAKAIYALLHISPFNQDVAKVEGIHKRVEFLGKAYAAGNKAFEEDEEAKQRIKDINYLVYASAQRFQAEKGVPAGSTDYLKFLKEKTDELDKVFDLWKKTRQWSLDYFETIYKRVYTHYDRYYFESECLAGVDIAKEAVEKGILEKSDGAIIFNPDSIGVRGKGLDTRVFVNSLGLPTYEAKELALAQKEFSEFGNLNRLIHVVGPEQASFFKVTFKVEELLDSQKYKDKQYHLAYGWVRLKHGKMSSRKGEVVLGEWLLDETKAQIKKEFPDMEDETLEKVAIGAVKYSMLKFGTTSEIVFSFEESISLEGNSGPYIQYTYARTRSVLQKSETRNPKSETNPKSKTNSQLSTLNFQLESEELSLLRTLNLFPEVISEAGEKLAPNLVANYLFDLAQKFNLFYQKHKIISSVILRPSENVILRPEAEESSGEEGSFAKAQDDGMENVQSFRLALTAAVGKVLKKGLYLLGIEAPERM